MAREASDQSQSWQLEVLHQQQVDGEREAGSWSDPLWKSNDSQVQARDWSPRI